MTDAESTRSLNLDTTILERLVGLICGDDDDLHYRRGFEIVAFFRAAGWSVPGEVDLPRRAWTAKRLREKSDDGVALGRLVLRLADPREYLDDRAAYEAVLRELNELLAFEGFEVVRDAHARPQLVRRDRDQPRPTVAAPAELRANLENIVSNRGFGIQLQARLEEAWCCWQASAPTAAIIMLGSVLEGVLYDVALHRHAPGCPPKDHLETLINTAGQERWVTKDVVDYAHVLRDHRNLVHPKKQWTQAYAPEGDTVRIAWNVVVAALNDLSMLTPPSGSDTTTTTDGSTIGAAHSS